MGVVSGGEIHYRHGEPLSIRLGGADPGDVPGLLVTVVEVAVAGDVSLRLVAGRLADGGIAVAVAVLIRVPGGCDATGVDHGAVAGVASHLHASVRIGTGVHVALLRVVRRRTGGGAGRTPAVAGGAGVRGLPGGKAAGGDAQTRNREKKRTSHVSFRLWSRPVLDGSGCGRSEVFASLLAQTDVHFCEKLTCDNSRKWKKCQYSVVLMCVLGE